MKKIWDLSTKSYRTNGLADGRKDLQGRSRAEVHDSHLSTQYKVWAGVRLWSFTDLQHVASTLAIFTLNNGYKAVVAALHGYAWVNVLLMRGAV
ncbi:hypothetical protein J6590_010677 [Homalodisca vitripennis]|nr:hypothetical protein J6590_010677 [Homalodisca vitripennis]